MEKIDISKIPFYMRDERLSGPEKFNELKLEFQCRKYNIDPTTITTDELLRLSIEADDMKKAVGPFDHTFSYFSNASRAYIEVADLMDKREKYIHKVTG